LAALAGAADAGKIGGNSAIPPATVLLVDEAKIPFFEGIEERRGKRVGRRFETVAYDMPRRLDPSTQAALIPEVALARGKSEVDVSEGDIYSYLATRGTRPAKLVESYESKLAMLGGFGPGRLTECNSLSMDRFHRSNPFRHAFHPDHGAGISIGRRIRIAFDSEQSAGQLQGDYEEEIEGLATDHAQGRGLIVRGRIALQRVVTVGTLQ
jgi:hypothetical protein